MEAVEVAVRSSDPVTEVGAVTILAGCAQLRVVDDAERERAAVVVIVEEFAGEEVFAFLRETRTESPPYYVLVTDHFRASDLMAAVECGVVAVLSRRETGDAELVSVVLSVSRGAAYFSPSLQGTLLSQLERMRRDVLEPNGLTLSGLASRERDVLRLVADGLGTEEIATELAYSERTVKNVLHGLMARFGLNTRAHAVAFALRAGVI
jgi:DNA-binding NarL/FixJ family response regulator